MNQTKEIVYKRINVIKQQLAETDKVSLIVEAIQAEGIETTETQTNKDIRAIYNGEYEDPWMSNFLNVIYPSMFKETIKELNDIIKRFKAMGDPKYSQQTVMSALINEAKVRLELLNLLHKGPAVKQMRNLKVKADKLARALEEERTITKKLP